MVKFPEPPVPSTLATIAPEVYILPEGTLLWRIYSRGGPYPPRWDEFRFYGPVVTSRFDHHRTPPSFQLRGVLYAAAQIATCVAEVFQETRVIDTADQDRDPWLAGFETARELLLLDLTGTWPTKAGASMAINTGLRSRARSWSRTIYEAYPQADGLLYCSLVHANRPAVALYERRRMCGRPHRPLTGP